MTSSDPVARGAWFGAGRPLLGWWSDPPSGRAASGVVIAPPIGYAYWSSHATLRALAEALAAAGHAVVRFDYDGTGDSSGTCWDADRVALWRASLAAAVAAMRARGVSHVTIVGLALGATFALVDGASLGADRVVAWAPVTSGKRFAKSFRLLGLATPAPHEGASVLAGVALAADEARALGELDAERLTAMPAPEVLVAARPEEPCAKLVASLRALAGDRARVDLRELGGLETVLDVPSEDAVVPRATIAGLVAWIGPGPEGARLSEPGHGARAELAWPSLAGNPLAVVEEVVAIGGLVGIETRPADGAAANVVAVFLNSGSEVHVGPGRCWVEYARALALHGIAALRVDFTGWGESPAAGHSPGRPYDAHCVGEALRVVAELRARGRRPVLVGLCAGAWIGMRVAQEAELLAGVVAINPQLYWEPGDPVEALLADTRKRREPIRAADAKVARYSGWSMLDAIGMRPMAGKWLRALRDRGARVLMVFAEGDDGLEYLRMRLGRRLRDEVARGWLAVDELADLDHQMYRVWRRGEVAARLVRFIASLAETA